MQQHPRGAAGLHLCGHSGAQKLAGMAGATAPVTSIRLRIGLLGFSNCVVAGGVPAELVAIGEIRRIAATVRVDLMVAVGLLVRVDIVVGHGVLHHLW